MADYGPAITWIVIIFILIVTGLVYMMLTPLIDSFLVLGANGGADPQTMAVIRDAIKVYFPIVVLFSIIVYGWRKSKNQQQY